MTRNPFAARFWQALLLLCAAGLCMPAAAFADAYDAAVAHAVAKHGHQDTPELREMIRGGLQPAEPALA